MKEPTVTVRTNPKFRPLRSIFTACIQVAVIGIGIVTESAAMQWAGFIVLILMALAIAIISAKKDEGLTISEARERLNELARKEA